jgi:hypothetical protein
MKRPFKKHYDFSIFGFHFVGTVSTHKWGWKKKIKVSAEQQVIKEVLLDKVEMLSK